MEAVTYRLPLARSFNAIPRGVTELPNQTDEHATTIIARDRIRIEIAAHGRRDGMQFFREKNGS